MNFVYDLELHRPASREIQERWPGASTLWQFEQYFSQQEFHRFYLREKTITMNLYVGGDDQWQAVAKAIRKLAVFD